jgi:hypothetical protein
MLLTCYCYNCDSVVESQAQTEDAELGLEIIITWALLLN